MHHPIEVEQCDGCVSCKGPFPGPNGSIHDYKPASSVPAVPNAAPSVQPALPSSSGADATAGAAAAASYQPQVLTHILPGAPGSIYASKPVTAHATPSAGQYATGSESGHVSPGLIATLPGPSGSIHDSKPASAGQLVFGVAEATASAGAGLLQPVATPSCSNTPGSPNSHCGTTPGTNIKKPFVAGPGLTGIIAILPGPGGSIHDSRPANSVSGVHEGVHRAGSTAGAGVSSGAFDGTGSITNIPPAHGPACVYTPGATTKCGSGVLQPSSQSGASAGAVANANANGASQIGATGVGSTFGSSSGSGSVSNIPSSHPIVGPTCSYSPGSPNKCGPVGGLSTAGAGENAATHAGAGAGVGSTSGSSGGSGSVANIPSSHPIVGPTCSYSPGSPNKCGSVIGHSTSETGANAASHAGAGAGVGSTSGFSSGSGSLTNIPSSHPIVGPVCSYTPGSPNKCGPVSGHSTEAGANAAAHAGAGGCISCKGPFPGPSGSINEYKPASSVASGASHVGEGINNVATGSYSSSLSGNNFAPFVKTNVTFPGPSGSIHEYKPSSSVSSSGLFHSGGGTNVAPGSSFSISGVLPGPSGSIHDYKPAPSVSLGGFHNAGGTNMATGLGSLTSGTLPGPIPVYKPAPSDASSDGTHGVVGINVVSESGASSINGAVSTPSIHPELPASGLYYINKPVLPSVDIEPPLVSSSPSFSGQIPCADSSCGSVQKTPFAPAAPVPQAGPASGAYSGFQASAGSSGQYESLNHDKAHLSGGIVFEDDDGSYHNIPTTTKRTYMNAEGGYAVSSNSADNTGFVIGPGTGLLPIESDDDNRPFGTVGASIGNAALAGGAAVKDDKPFGTQGAFGGSAAFSKSSANTHSSGNSGSGTGLLINHSGDQRPFGTVGAATGHAALATGATVNDVKDDKPFGTQGAFGGSAAFSKSTASAENSEIQPISGNSNDFDAGDFAIQKSEGILVTPVSVDSDKPACGAGGGCGSGNNVFSGSGLASETSYFNGQVNKEAANSPVKLECTGSSCGDTEVFVIEERPSNLYSGSGSRSGSASGSGFATGQVLVNQGGSTHDVTNSGSNNAIGGSYSGSQGGAYSGNSQYGSSGCSQCGGYHGFGVAGSFGVPHPGGFLDKLFGAGGLSGTTALNRYGGSGAYSNAGSYASGGAGSFASAGASASAHSGSYASSF